MPPREQEGKDAAAKVTSAPEAEQHNELVTSVTEAYDKFDNPKQFNEFLKGMTDGLGNNSGLLHDLQITNSQDLSPSRTDSVNKLNALYGLKDTEGLVEVLDNYHEKQDDYDFVRSDWNPFQDDKDGNIGEVDLQRFIEDAKAGNPNTIASKFLEDLDPEEQEKIKGIVQTLADSNLDDGINGNTVNVVGEKLGFGNAEDPAQRAQFQQYFGVDTGAEESTDQQTGQGTSVRDQYDHGAIYSFKDGSGKVTEVGINRDESGVINAFNKKNADGTEQQFKMTDKGWVVKDANGNEQPWNGTAPSLVDKGDGTAEFVYYEKTNDPNVVNKRGFDSSGNPISMDGINLNGVNNDQTPVAIPGINRTPDVAVGQQSRLGDLNTHGADGYKKLDESRPDTQSETGKNAHHEYTIEDGTNLTTIARQILKGRPGEGQPEAEQRIIDEIAKANGYEDPNLIYAGAQLQVPVDLQY